LIASKINEGKFDEDDGPIENVSSGSVLTDDLALSPRDCEQEDLDIPK
jgi:hypothetical protein